MSLRAVRRARVVLTIGHASWRVCESCADLLERERRVHIVVPAPGPTNPSRETGKRPKPARQQPQQQTEAKARKGRRKPAPLVRAKGSLAREERREAKRSKARTRELRRTPKKTAIPFGAAGVKGGRQAEMKRRRAEWLAGHPAEEAD